MGPEDHTPSPVGDDAEPAQGRSIGGRAVSLDLPAEELDDPIVIWSSLRDDDGEIVDFVYEYVNSGAVETIGIPADGLLGARLLEVLPVHVELGLFDRYRAVAETGITDGVQIPWFEDGTVAGARGGTTVVRRDDGEATARAGLGGSLEQFEDVLDELPDGVLVMDHGVFQYANAEAARIFGLATASELIGLGLAEFVSPDALEKVTEYGLRVQRSGRADEKFVVSIRSRTGDIVQVELTPTVAPGGDRALLVIIRDVTERNRLLADLARSEATGRFLTENSSDVLLRAGRDHRISFASAASIAILGHAPGDLLGTTVDGLFAVDDRPLVDHALETARDDGVAAPVELQVPRSGAAEPMWVELEVRSVALPDEAHEFHITLYDIRRDRADREALRLSEHRLTALIDGAPVGIFELDTDGRCTFVNSRYCDTVGVYGLDDVADRRWIGLIHPDDRQMLFDRWADPSTARAPFELSVRFMRATGEEVHTVVRIEPVLTTSGDVSGWLGTVEDISERITLERERRAATELFEAAFDHAPTGLVLMTVDEFPPRLIKANAAKLQMTGQTEDELRATDFYEVTHPDDVAAAAAGRAALLSGEIDTHHMEIRQRFGSDAAYRWFDLVRSVVRDDDGTPLHLVAQSTDITDRKNTEQLHYHLAVTDPLTGLSNRRHFDDRLANTHARLLRSDQLIGVVFLDLDHFKTVNDELGHRAGDEVLQRIAQILIAEVRPGDTVARFGGDEFVILAEHHDQEELIRIAERLREAIDLYRVLPGGAPHRITASIGIASRHARDVTPDELIQLADQAMYRAKRDGRRRCMVAEPF